MKTTSILKQNLMKLKQASTIVGLLASSALAFSVAPAHAASFTAADGVAAGCVGQTSCVVNDFFTLTAGPGAKEITQKTEGGVLGLGVAQDADKLNFKKGGDQSGGEIDVDEVLTVAFAKTSILDFLDLSFLYRPGVYADRVFEIALVDVLGSAMQGMLTVTGQTSATWSLGGTVTNLSPSKKGSGGSYRIDNPFGDMKIAGFSLFPKDNSNVASFHDSDFSLSAVGATAVPEPATVVGLLGVAALGKFGLRRKKAQKA